MANAKKNDDAAYTVPGLRVEDGHRVAEVLQGRLHALNDLQLTLKHAHWNVVGPGFIGVHEMLDPQIEKVRAMVDVVAERIATLGVSPAGTPGVLVADRTWDDYSLGRASTLEHLAALDLVYDGVVTDHRAAIDATEDLDPVTQDILIDQVAQLELFQWFMRSFLTTDDGRLSSAGAATEAAAAGRVKDDQAAPAPQGARTKKSGAKKATASNAKKSKKK
ncbi:DNA starvation/stationary phase protection protein [Micrococcus sp. EYE_162]|uniref:Dps family protein n=1 Tax=unclassified Micrococcus TaxID=2620948 RepID=UPI00200671C4|nr:DNA starvation/stationary phase protection protein [Micrococcus sp. EYE_212]MCK6171378.1 DNA starvation/stationary phase protection protein [Micrococcus sp. EYE_162]